MLLLPFGTERDDIDIWQPVLDIKPYLPYCDAVPDAIAPSWVKVFFLLGSFYFSRFF